MKTNNTILFKLLGTKLAILLLIAGSTIAAFATLGDGKSAKKAKSNFTLLAKENRSLSTFSLRSCYDFRGNQVIGSQGPKFVSFTTTLTYKKGYTTYALPIQKKVFLDKIVFNDDLLRNGRRP